MVKSNTAGILRQAEAHQLRRDQSDRFGPVSPRGEAGEKIAPEDAVANAVAAINTQLNAPQRKPQPRSDSPRTATTPRGVSPRGVAAASSGESNGQGVDRAGFNEGKGADIDKWEHAASSYPGNTQSRYSSLDYSSHAYGAGKEVAEINSSELETRLW